MSKYVIAWPHRIGTLYFRKVQYPIMRSYGGTEEPKTLLRTANLSEARIYNSFDDANEEFTRHIEPDTTAEIVLVTDKEIFHAKLADDPVASKKKKGISS